MKITVDTNVLISATFWNGLSSKILKKAELEEFELVLSDDILNEYLNVLNYSEIKDKIDKNNLEVKLTIEQLLNFSEIVTPKVKLNEVKEDPSDNIILECALEGKVDYIVSQDNHLLKLKEFRGIKILKPDEFLSVFADYG